MDDVVLWIVVGTALAFDFTNGFHDTANAVATSISTRAMPPRVAVSIAAVLNFVGAFLSLAVAATIAGGIVDADLITPAIVFSGLIGAIAWNLATWYYGLPSSSSHALIGGVVGSTFAAAGPDAVLGAGIVEKVVVPALVAPVLALAVTAVAISLCYRIVGRRHPGPVSRGFRLGQIISGSLFSLSHGTNDAQKTMGIIFLALVANGNLSTGDDVPTWVVLSAATAIALGTYVGGWRIIRTMGSRIIKMDPAQGFAAESSGAAVILSASHVGFPLSTTQVISGSIMGAGAAKRLSAVRWGVAGNIVIAWVLTLPASAGVGALTYGVVALFGTHEAGPLVVAGLLLTALLAALIRRIATGRPITAEG
ncbi:MAG: inorganic phosphate transporter [Actinomycetota bacterium]|nr:inorganic phosphate transporter [Actinomycetota bacterium]